MRLPAPLRVSVFQLLGRAPVRTSSFPRPLPGRCPQPQGAAGCCSLGLCSLKAGASDTNAHPRVCPGPHPAPLSSPGEHEAGMMDVFFLRQTRPEQPSTWLWSQGPSPSPGTCSAAPSTARHRSCCSPGRSIPGFAPGDSWPAPWGPSLVLGCTGR